MLLAMRHAVAPCPRAFAQKHAASFLRSFATVGVTIDTTAVTAQPLQLTDAFAQRMADISRLQGRQQYLRVQVVPGGCDGFQYSFELCEPTSCEPDDVVLQHQGQACVVDPASLEKIRFSTITYASDLMQSRFQVVGNPNSSQSCSCGTSFMPKS
eukprot:TRINITY_DN27292_c0_g1_i1.p1 TRINITY_DN27292_c0_g1~~TRINITY_DN27292_c0_g1_i1.p1  ORF type:complete len:155 (+),score=13.99 TRINITY_DN27292_c0_g1_i1:43-507(+)